MLWRALFISLACSACTKYPYPYHISDGPVADDQFSRGAQYVALDESASWTFGLFSKLIILDSSIDSHEIGKETEQAARLYVRKNGLGRVKVRLNEYAPLDEWSRLFNNTEVGILWRVTAGSLTTLLYTILPGRLFGGDNYNPFTDTVSLYSDHPAVALHELAHAKDFAGRKWKGSYAVLRLLPLIALFQEKDASGDVLGYFEDNRAHEEKARAYRVLYPAYGTYVGGELVRALSFFTSIPQLVFLVPVIPGHIVGRLRASESLDEQCSELKQAAAQLSSDRPDGRAAAAITLGQAGARAARYVPLLEGLAEDQDETVRAAGSAAIDRIQSLKSSDDECANDVGA